MRNAILAGAIGAVALLAQDAATPKFEAASLKPSTACGASGGSVGRNGGGSGASPGRLDLKCRTAVDLIRTAYLQFADGKRTPPGRQAPIEGGPAWIHSERYDIDAKAAGPATREMMSGPMLQALLEDRLKLKLHRETRDVPVYALTVAKGGAKLQPAQEGKCFPRDTIRLSDRPPGLLPCGVFAPSAAKDGVNMYGTTLANLCTQLSVVLDRDVIDKTGIAGVFDIHIDAPPADPVAEVPSDSPPRGPVARANLADPLGAAVLHAIQQVGLKLEPAKGPGEFLVIDHVEKPSEN
jgi:uncharacterized protein (TIGR03435 family)